MIHKDIKEIRAFTLAEVLITLGIIGIVAAMTIPTIIQNAKNQQTVSALKKTYSTLSQAYSLAVQENGTPDNWGLIAPQDPQGSENIMNALSPRLRLTKNCGRNAGCFPIPPYKFLKGGDTGTSNDTYTGIAKAQMADGTFILTETFGDCNQNRGTTPALQSTCGDIYIDINGYKPPNQFGVDYFGFWLTKNGIVPLGTQQNITGGQYSGDFDGSCKDKTSAAGYGCAAWVIYNENMDYLKCNTLSWDGAKTCP